MPEIFDEKEMEDLNLLVKLGEKQDGKLNSMLVSNIFAGFPTKRQTEEVYNQMIEFLEKSKIQIINDDSESEVEEEDSNSVIPEIRPFDPSKIDIAMKPMEMSSILKRLERKEINMMTYFQRKGGLWTNIQKSRLIESLFLCVPIPAFYFDGEVQDDWLIIDGLQRLTALKEFVVDKTLKLTGLEFYRDLEGALFSELPRTFVRRIEETSIIAYIIKAGTPKDLKYNIFKRINTGGLALSPQEIRHALYQGHATEICKRFAQIPEFRLATTYSIRDDRMVDQEFVLRFMAVCYYGIDKYEGIPDNYLNDTMNYLNQKECVDEELMRRQFCRVMTASRNIMGKYAFRKLGEDGIRRPINKAIYEAWCRALFILNDKELKTLEEMKEIVYERTLKLCKDPTFLSAIRGSDKKGFLQRFAYVDDMLRGVLNDSKN